MKPTEIRFNYDKLRGLMREKKVTQDDLAKAINLSATSLSGKLNSKVMFSPKEMLGIQKALQITDNDFKTYFFSLEVRKTEKTESRSKQPS
ncbi:DUF739 family protein [Carnobacterium maltaromaticum]|uniref:DUF739 family protein n=1 Tax=Carnobacterium maltaromaticum TaxID=2751 RepID=UPI0039BE3475